MMLSLLSYRLYVIVDMLRNSKLSLLFFGRLLDTRRGYDNVVTESVKYMAFVHDWLMAQRKHMHIIHLASRHIQITIHYEKEKCSNENENGVEKMKHEKPAHTLSRTSMDNNNGPSIPAK